MKMMGQLSTRFCKAANAPKSIASKKRKRPSPLSIRISDEEREKLKCAANGQSLNSYARERLFAGKASRRSAVADHEALAKALSLLGRSDIHTKLSALLLAIEAGKLEDADGAVQDIKQASAYIKDIRACIVTALGLKG